MSEDPTRQCDREVPGEQELPWSWITLVGNLAPMSDRVLDLGTGDGETLATLADVLPEGTVATVGRRSHLPVARDRLATLGIEVHDHGFDRHGSRLPFPSDSVDLVLCRQESYDPREVARVLAPGGTFLTQQVGGDDLCELDGAFVAEPPYPGATLERAVHDLTRAGLTVERSDAFHGTVRFDDVESLLGYLRRVAWQEPDGSDGLDPDHRRRELEALAQELPAAPLSLSISRFLVLARAPSAPDVGRTDFADLLRRADLMPEIPRV
ncbi:class I SAM-dependent methyltransferase [Brachybacterium sp. AOP3-A1-3]|uniref:class I SAM-dependent methyltransferase n=1 Tax=Brachybacterium sp. AOP3-A1-3 TaxID=3457699 RepID=UPI004033D5EB